MPTLLTKINGLAYASINKYSGLAKGSTKKVGGTRNFLNNNAVAKSITAPGDLTHAISIADSDGDFKFTDDSAFSVSFWIKVGWDTSANASVILFDSMDVGGGSGDDEIRVVYYEPLNRVYFYMYSDGSNYMQQFWHSENSDPAGDRDYSVMLTASGLGHGGNWNAANRGNVGDDDYTLITITKDTANSNNYPNLKMYWNAADCGYGYYGTASPSGVTGTPNLGSSTDKMVSMGSYAWDGGGPGNNVETKFMGLTIWDKDLDASEVTELYNSGAPLHVGTHSAYANCVGWHPFEDDGAGEITGTQTFAINGDSNLEAK